MDGIVINADTIGQILTYIAPGYLVYLGYRLRYPGPHRPGSEVFIIAIAGSLPLVALADQLRIAHEASDLRYVAILLGGALLLGYLTALLRGRRRVKGVLGFFGYRHEPESSIYAQTLSQMSDEGLIQVELQDGRRIIGAPRNGPQYKDDGINELYLVYPEVVGDDNTSTPIPGGPGIIVPLSEVANIVLGEDPTGAPPPEDDAPAAALGGGIVSVLTAGLLLAAGAALGRAARSGGPRPTGS
jgi:hypothetical protein